MSYQTAFATLLTVLEQSGPRVIALQRDLTATRALGPENGGDGEWQKADYLLAYFASLGIAPRMTIEVPDERVSRGSRPNLVFNIPGKSKRTLWLFAHMDVVGAGNLDAWSSNPWEVRRSGDWLYGRGVEDNQQAIVSMLLLAEAFSATKCVPELSLGLVFMADEENGSHYGLAHVLKHQHELFEKNDFFIVPDFGSPDAAHIEIAEKAQLWLKFTTIGTQCHASMPHLGNNAFLAASDLVTQLHAGLNETFYISNRLFDPQISTFVPTRHEPNVGAINILPGQDVFYLDCRILPDIDPEEVITRAKDIATAVANQHHVQTEVEIVQLQKASSLPFDTPAFNTLQDAVSAVYGCSPRAIGVGGGTVAALLREQGWPALVWACLENTCHQPNERSSITATCKDAQVFARMLKTANV